MAETLQITELPEGLLRYLTNLDEKQGLRLFCREGKDILFIDEVCNDFTLAVWEARGSLGNHGSLAQSGKYDKLVKADVLDDIRPFLPFENYPSRLKGHLDKEYEKKWWSNVRRHLVRT